MLSIAFIMLFVLPKISFARLIMFEIFTNETNASAKKFQTRRTLGNSVYNFPMSKSFSKDSRFENKCQVTGSAAREPIMLIYAMLSR